MGCRPSKGGNAVSGRPRGSETGSDNIAQPTEGYWNEYLTDTGAVFLFQLKGGLRRYEVLNFEVSGDRLQAVHMLPGYTHNIINLSETENLVTVMWANETFDPGRPDTFFEKVEK